jgi:uncharacterized coiled-coil protein SlyX
MAIMPTQIESILNKLTPEEQKVIESLLNTIAMQAEIIREMSRDLEDYAGAAAENTALRSDFLVRIAQLLKKPVVQGLSIQEINTATGEMKSAIKKAQSGVEALDTVLNFAGRVAPIFLA